MTRLDRNAVLIDELAVSRHLSICISLPSNVAPRAPQYMNLTNLTFLMSVLLKSGLRATAARPATRVGGARATGYFSTPARRATPVALMGTAAALA